MFDWIPENWSEYGVSLEHAFMMLGWVVSLVMTLLIVPWLKRLYRMHKEQVAMIKKKLFENTGVVIYGVFDKKLQSDYLGGFLTTLFGEVLFDLIVGWNEEPSPSIIVPQSEAQSDHLKEILAAHASPYILQSSRIDCYFANAKRYGTEHYPFAKLVVALARPDAHKLASHDYPRVIVIEQGMLQTLMNDTEIDPQWKTKEGYTWLETVRELGRRFFAGELQGITVLEIPLEKQPLLS